MIARLSLLSRHASSFCVAAALLPGCGGPQLPIGAPSAMPQSRTIAPTHLTVRRRTSSYRVLYSFGGYANDGIEPQAGLIDVDGTLYGTTHADNKRICDYFTICGTVFSITTDGAEKVLHTFGKGTDGHQPRDTLIDVGGRLYGTTFTGGTMDAGTVFSITTGGKERVLYSFGGNGDGAYPISGLLDVDGTLYGTTVGGGVAGSPCDNRGCGTVFRISTSGSEKVLYRFKGGEQDGSQPWGDLIDVRGTLYGTTAAGGILSGRGGTVFSVSTRGQERVVHFFGKGYDGVAPEAGLLDVSGVLYGTTNEGGSQRQGTVFTITTTGKETVLYSFNHAPDGEAPQGSLLDVNGTLYSTTYSGGEYGPGLNRWGTVFAIQL